VEQRWVHPKKRRQSRVRKADFLKAGAPKASYSFMISGAPLSGDRLQGLISN